jgi:hypothetical protein
MTTETAKKESSNAVRIQQDKKERAARVARRVAAEKDQRVSAAAVIDEILEEGLSKRERKLGIEL